MELIKAGKAPAFIIAAIARDALSKLAVRDVIDRLREHGTANGPASLSGQPAERPQTARPSCFEFESVNLYTVFKSQIPNQLLDDSEEIAGQY